MPVDCYSVVSLDATCAQVIGQLIAPRIQFLIGPTFVRGDDGELVWTSSSLIGKQFLNRLSLPGVEGFGRIWQERLGARRYERQAFDFFCGPVNNLD